MGTCILLNPEAGGGRRRTVVRRALAHLPAAVVRTIGDPRGLADAAAGAGREGFDLVVAAGGDGTVGAVAAGLIDGGSTARLGILPIGTGNDFARELGLTGGPQAAARALLEGRTRRIDAIRCARPGDPVATWAVNAAVAGLGGRIADSATRPLRRRWGRLAYLRAGLGELARASPVPLALVVDERRYELEALMVVVAGGRFAAGGLAFAPDADPSDGRLDVVVVLDTPPIMLAPTLAKLLRGVHTGADNVLSVGGARVALEVGTDVWMNLDGETWGSGSAEFEAAPGVLEVVVP